MTLARTIESADGVDDAGLFLGRKRTEKGKADQSFADVLGDGAIARAASMLTTHS
jgi:hypothetical protein